MDIKRILQSKRIKAIVLESWSISWPMTLIMFFVSLIGMGDIYVAGRFGKEIKAAYGLGFQIYFIFMIISMALSIGSVSVISRLSTQAKKEENALAIKSSLIFTAICGVVFTIIGRLASVYIVGSLNVPIEIKSYARSLVSIYFLGLLFHYLMMNTNALLRSSNRIRKSLSTMAIVAILNIALNIILSFHTRLSFRGIAISTVISLFIGNILNLYHLRKSIRGAKKLFSTSIIKKILHISWPAGLLQIFWQLGIMAIFFILGLLPYGKIEVIAAFTNGLKIESMIFLPAFAFNMANAVVVGNMLGKKEKDNAFYTGIITALMGVVFISTLTLAVVLNARAIASFFSNDNLVIQETVKYMTISLIFEPIMAWGVILGGALNGAGDTKTVMKAVASSVWFIRIPLSYILVVYFGYGAIFVWWSMNVSILMQTAFLTKRYFNKKWIECGASLTC